MDRVHDLCQNLAIERNPAKLLTAIKELQALLESDHQKLMDDFDELQRVSSEQLKKLL